MFTCSGLRQDFNFVSPAAENTLSARYGCSNKQLDVGNFRSVHLPKMVQLVCSLNKDWQLDNFYYWNETFGSVRWLNTFHKDLMHSEEDLRPLQNILTVLLKYTNLVVWTHWLTDFNQLYLHMRATYYSCVVPQHLCLRIITVTEVNGRKKQEVTERGAGVSSWLPRHTHTVY